MLKFDVKRKINTLRDILVGKVPDPKAQVEQITIAMIYKFMDDMDIEAIEFGGNRKFFTGEYEKYAWTEIMQSENGGQQRANLYAEGIDKMAMNPNLPQLFRDIFRGAYVPYRDPDTLNMFLKEISDFTYDNSEDLGNAFEYLLSIMGSQGDAGQFRTPRHIIDMIVNIVDPKKNESILDPACGTAGFLISAYKHIAECNKDENGKSTLNTDDRKRLTNNFAGYDISPDMVRLARVNMYLHQFAKPQISEYDTLSSTEKWDDSYDVILANPPFMTPKGGIIPHNRYRVQAKRAELLFVDYIAEHLNPTGRAGIIVPEGIVFQSANAYKELRKYLVEEGFLYAVISLPAGVFNPYSGVKTSILLLDKPRAKCSDNILFVKMQNDGFDLGAQRRGIKQNDIPKIVKAISDYKLKMLDDTDIELSVEEKQFCTIVNKKKIEEQDYILVGDRYKEAVVVNSDWPMVELGEICETTSGGTPKSTVEEYYTGGNIPWLTSGEVANGHIFATQKFITEEGLRNSSAKLLPINTVLVAMYGATAGQVGILKISSATNQAVCGILPNEKFIPEYLYLVLKAKKEYLISLCSGGAQPNISQTIIKKLQIPLPPLSVQEEIVAEIEGYQKIIDGAKQIVDNYKPTIKIDPSWDMVKLGDVCELQSGGTPLKSNDVFWNGNDYAWYTSGELNEVYTDNPLKYISEQGLNNSSARIFPKGSLLIGMYDTAAFKMSILDRVATFNQAICGIKPNDKIDMFFLMQFFSSQREKYLNMRVGARQRNLTKQFISDLKIAMPPLETQQQIVEQIKEEMDIVEQNKRLIAIFEQKIADKIAEVWGE